MNPTYTVKAGDNLSTIAANNKTSIAALAGMNNIQNPNLIRVGAVLKLPGVTPAPVVTPPAPGAPIVAPPGGTPPGTPAQPLYDVATGFVTPYGVSQGAKPTQPNDPAHAATPRIPTTPATGIPVGTPTPADISTAETAAFSTPSKTSQQVYTDAYSAAGLGTLKTNIDTLNAAIAAKQAQLTEALGTINENPFLDEKTRIGRGKNITDTANAEIANLNSQLKSAGDLYTQGLSEVNGVVTRNSTDFTADQTVAQNKLTFLQKLAEDAYNKMKDNKTAPTTIGDAAVGFYRWDPNLQKFVQTIAPKNPTSNMPAEQFNRTATSEMGTHLQKIADQNGKLTPTQYKSAKNQWIAQSGLPGDLFDKSFAGMAYIGNGSNGSTYTIGDYGIPTATWAAAQ